MTLLYGIPYLSIFIRYIWYDVLKRGPFRKIMLPIVKNVNTNWSLKDLASVQPMSQPQGQSFYVDFVSSKIKRKWYQLEKRK